MSHMNNLHAIQNEMEPLHAEDFDHDAPGPITLPDADEARLEAEGRAEAEAFQEGEARRQQLQASQDRYYGTPYVRVYMPNNLPQPTPPEGYTITRAALRTDGRLGTLHSEGKTLDECTDRMAEHFDDVFILSVEAEGPTEDGSTGTQYSEWKVGRQGGKWSEWQWL